MSRRSLLLGLCAVISLAACLVVAEEPSKNQASQSDIVSVAEGSNAMAMDMYAKLTAQKGNLFLSPASVETALAMTYAGAGGNTADQMARTLHFTLAPQKLHPAFAALTDKLNRPAEITLYDGKGKTTKAPAYQLTVANALWGQEGFAFKSDFTKLLDASYGAGMHQVDYKRQTEKARTTINDWVAVQTKDKIKDLIGQGVLTSDTRLVLTNAVYFKSNWATKFVKEATKDGPFKLSADKSIDVPMMTQQHHFSYMENDDLQAVELPYKANELGMIILLPRKVDGLAAIEKDLTTDNVAKWLKAMKRAEVDLTMPKFKFESQFSLADTLKSMGMIDAFDPVKADFSGMTDQDRLFISAVIHKAFVAVDEEGTEAAAATAVAMALTAMPVHEEPKIFKADHPFVFLIRHNATGEILFMGRLSSPG